MSDAAKKILWSIGLSVPSIVFGVILRKVIQTWGIFDPFAEWLGGWLKMHVSPAQVEWTIAGVIALAGYACLLGLVWRYHRTQQITDIPLGTREQRRKLSLKEIDLHQFLRFVGIDPMDRLPPSSNKAYNAFEKLRQLARDGKVRVKGKPGFKYRSPYMSWKPAELIYPIYWRDAQVFSLDVLGASDINNISTMPDDAMGKGKSQADVYKWLTLIEDDIKANFKENEFSMVKQ